MVILIFIIVLAILVLAHEWGHFIVAKKNGLIVEEFGFGFPPKLFSFKKGETLYSINLLPLGGFVKILGEDGSETDNHRSFASRSVGTRSLITVGGVTMNFILAALLLTVGFYIGTPQAVDGELGAAVKNIQIQIVAVSHNSPAENVGLKLGDSIRNFDEVVGLQDFVNKSKGKEITLDVRRGEENLEVKIIPRINPPEGEGALGIALAKTGIVSYPWHKSIWLGIKSAFVLIWAIAKGFAELIKNLIISGRVPQDISGPVGIAVLTGQAAQLGFIYLLNLVALISLNLVVLNILPFPALDGGRLLFLGIEKIKGSKVNPKIENAIHGAGLAILLFLVILITYRDILKFLKS